MDGDDSNTLSVSAKNSTEEASLGKLLQSHASVYDALNNPDLDVNIPRSPPFPLPELGYSPSPLDLAGSISSWQNVSLPAESVAKLSRLAASARSSGGASPASVYRPASASILSNTDEEDESMVVVPSAGKGSAVMVFETDEEDDDEGPQFPDYNRRHNSCPMAAFGDIPQTTTQKRGSLPSFSSSSFIMPKISLSDTQQKQRLTILTSSESGTKTQTAKLIAFIRTTFKTPSSRLQITHLALSSAPSKLDMSILRSSDLVFVINDGAMIIPEVLQTTTQAVTDTELPRLTVVNVISTNYFINLVDIISAWRPYQIWKTVSLSNKPFLSRIKGFVDVELFDTSGGRYAEELEARKRKMNKDKASSLDSDEVSDTDAMAASDSMYDSLVRPSRPDYRVIERSIRSELQMSHSFSDTDPLRLSSDSHRFVHLFRILKVLLGLPSDGEGQGSRPNRTDSLLSYISSMVPSRNVWLICSFSMGLGVGLTVASGAATVFAVQFYNTAKLYSTVAFEKVSEKLTCHPAPEKLISNVSSKSLGHISSLGDNVNNHIVSWSHKVVDATTKLTEGNIVDDLLAWLNSYIQNIKSFSSLAMAAAHNGFEKTMRLLSNIGNITV